MAEGRGRDLPEELQDEILRRLPIKSLIRFESVCQTWQSKFQSRSFVDLYGRRPCHSGGVVCNDDNPLGLHTIDKKTLRGMIPGIWNQPLLDSMNTPTTPGKLECWVGTAELVGPTSNGIYCLMFVPEEDHSDALGLPWIRIGLCNPATRDYKLLDPFPPRIHSILSSKPGGRVQFGFGKIGLEYKVVVIAHHGKSFVCLVYSSQQGKHGEWKKIVDYKHGRKRNFGHRKSIKAFKDISSVFYNFEACPQKFLEGCWHWGATTDDFINSHRVLSFNFADESFKLMGMPEPDLTALNALNEIFVLHGRHLAFIYIFGTLWTLPHLVEQVDIWVMMEYGVEKSWTRIFRIKVYRLLGMECTPLKGDIEEESGDIQIERLIFQDEDDKHRIISCDDAGHKLCGLWDPTTKYFLNNSEISTFVETLEPL